MSSETRSSSRRWSRFLDLLPSRARRRTPAVPPPDYTPDDNRAHRRSRRHRQRRPPSQVHNYTQNQSHSTPTLPSQAAMRFRRPDDFGDDDSSDGDGRSAIVSSAFTELDAMQDHDLLAVVHRIIDESHSSGSDYQASSLYVGRLPHHHARSRVPMRVHNAYYITGRRHGRHSQLTTELERELRLNMRTLGMNMSHMGAGSDDYAASDDQIEALPAFVMEKGETRCVRDIFASMRNGGDGGEDGDEKMDECGGLMTSYTECAICLSDFEPGDEITALPCGHFFHLTGCVREWLRNHSRTCPTCRADICVTSSSSDGFGSHSATMATSEEMA